jgi:DNA helicase-2/ATP-dependent DNA helicase PcrA
MSSTNKVVISAAGGGKTTRIVTQSLASSAERSVLLTYTNNNVGELEKRFYELNSALPVHAEIWSWYKFLLREMARPYQKNLINGRIDGIFWVEDRRGVAVYVAAVGANRQELRPRCRMA